MWYVLYTKPRNEKKVAALLAAQNVMVYCPTQISIRQWSDRKKKVEEPVFKSYIFVKLSDYKNENVEVLRTPGAVRFLWYLKKPGIVRDHEIQAIKIFTRNYTNIQSIAHTEILPGDHVKIISGPLKDKEGDLIKVRGQRAFLRIQSLGIELQAELPLMAIERTFS